MEEINIILKEKKKFSKVKNNCYNQIVNCPNKKVSRDCLNNVEIVERIGLRGIDIKIANEKIELVVGHNTNNAIITSVLIPISKRYGLPNSVIGELENMVQVKRIKGFKKNMSQISKGLYLYGKKYFESLDTYGHLKAESFSNDTMYAISSLGERKCIAYENKNKRLKQ